VRFTHYSFGSLRVDGVTYEHDLIIDRGKIRKRKKAASRKFRDQYGHTPLSAAEDVPWRCRRLVIGSGAHGAGDRRVGRVHEGHQRDLAPDMLTRRVTSAGLIRLS
jgi:hypothetical protein